MNRSQPTESGESDGDDSKVSMVILPGWQADAGRDG